MSEKPVFNYFATKEDLVLGGREEIEAGLLRAVRERPPGEPVVAAVRRHTLAVAERTDALPAARRAAFRKVVQGAPSVLERVRQLSLRDEEELAALLADETSAPAGDPTPRVVAGVLGVLARLGFGVAGWPDTRRRSHAEVAARASRDVADLGPRLYDVAHANRGGRGGRR